jgi:tRNA 2-thiouridine synthesizing protein A
MTAVLEASPEISRTIDARGSFCPGPLMELIRAIRDGQVGDVIAIRSTDRGSRTDIPAWVQKAGHRLISLVEHPGFDEIVVRKER